MKISLEVNDDVANNLLNYLEGSGVLERMEAGLDAANKVQAMAATTQDKTTFEKEAKSLMKGALQNGADRMCLHWRLHFDMSDSFKSMKAFNKTGYNKRRKAAIEMLK